MPDQLSPPDILERQFAANIAALRRDRGLSQQELADAMTSRGHAFHQTTVNKVEDGKRKVSLVEAIDLASIFDVSIELLIRDTVSGIGGAVRQALLTYDQYATISSRISYLARHARILQEELGESAAAIKKELKTADPESVGGSDVVETLQALLDEISKHDIWEHLATIPVRSDRYNGGDIEEMVAEATMERNRERNLQGLAFEMSRRPRRTGL